MTKMKNEVRLSGYNFMIKYEGIESDVSTDACLKFMLYDGSITPDPFDNNHTPRDIKEFVEQMFWEGKAIGLD